MSKYGPGISMKTMQQQEMEEVRRVLRKYRMSKKDRDVIIDALKEAYYQWCDTNASSCLQDEVLRQLISEEAYVQYMKLHINLAPAFIAEKMEETYAWWDEDMEDD